MALKLPAAEAANVAIQLIGCGYDISLDLRLKYRKRRYLSDFGNNPYRNCRLIEIEEDNGRDIVLPGGLVAFNVSNSIKFDEGEHRRLQSDVLSFQQVCLILPFFLLLVATLFALMKNYLSMVGFSPYK